MFLCCKSELAEELKVAPNAGDGAHSYVRSTDVGTKGNCVKLALVADVTHKGQSNVEPGGDVHLTCPTAAAALQCANR